MVTFGCSNHGTLGHGDEENKLVPTTVAGLDGVVGVATGAAHAVAYLTDGQLRAWGSNEFGQLGSDRVRTGNQAGSAQPVTVTMP